MSPYGEVAAIRLLDDRTGCQRARSEPPRGKGDPCSPADDRRYLVRIVLGSASSYPVRAGSGHRFGFPGRALAPLRADPVTDLYRRMPKARITDKSSSRSTTPTRFSPRPSRCKGRGYRAAALPALILGGVLEQLAAAPSEIDVRDDGLRLEDYPIVIRAHARPVELLGEVCDVVAQPEEVLLVVDVADLAGDLELIRFGLRRSKALRSTRGKCR